MSVVLSSDSGRDGTHNYRVSLTRKNLQGVYRDHLLIHTVGLDDSQRMPVDGENVVRLARHGNQAHTVAFALHNVRYGDWTGWAACIATKAVYEY